MKAFDFDLFEVTVILNGYNNMFKKEENFARNNCKRKT